MLQDLDPIIDDVARQMTSAPADAGLAGRIATYIASSDATRRRAWTRPSMLVPLAAACVLILAVVVARRLTIEPPRHAAAELAQAAPAVVSSDPPAAIQNVELRRGRVSYVATAIRERRQDTRVAAPPVLPAIDVAPLEVNGLDVRPLVEPEHIDIDPIAIARIEIAPMP